VENRVGELLARAIDPTSLQVIGSYTAPRSWGVYQLIETSSASSATKLFRLGNHPVRLQELEREFRRVRTVALFTSRSLAEELAGLLNHSGA